MNEYQRGYRQAYFDALGMYADWDFTEEQAWETANKLAKQVGRGDAWGSGRKSRTTQVKPKKPKRKKSAKQKLLQEMTDRKWKSYKRKYPKGKKTWIKIRAEVSRSQVYKKKAKRLG